MCRYGGRAVLNRRKHEVKSCFGVTTGPRRLPWIGEARWRTTQVGSGRCARRWCATGQLRRRTMQVGTNHGRRLRRPSELRLRRRRPVSVPERRPPDARRTRFAQGRLRCLARAHLRHLLGQQLPMWVRLRGRRGRRRPGLPRPPRVRGPDLPPTLSISRLCERERERGPGRGSCLFRVT
jgi:hypothetical protein